MCEIASVYFCKNFIEWCIANEKDTLNVDEEPVIWSNTLGLFLGFFLSYVIYTIRGWFLNNGEGALF